MKPFMPIVACLMGLMIAATCGAYPLDGYGYTGIARVEAYRLAMEGKVRAPKQPPGALLPIDQVDIRLAARSDVEIPPPDAEFAARLKNLLGAEADRYAVSVLDLSNPELPRYAEHRSTARANPGSVGKILIALGLFQALADVYPDNIDERLEILRNTVITADEFIQSDHHVVPVWQPGNKRVRYPKIQIGDQASQRQLFYMVVVMSNVLRKNSAVVHQTLATRIHRMLEKYYRVGKFSSGSSQSGKQPHQGQQ